MAHFGDADADGDGAIDFEEFKSLYTHLGGTVESPSAELTSGESTTVESDSGPEEHPLRKQFDKYDLNNDGVLDKPEVAKMLESLGYASDPKYHDELMQSFARFDINDDGVITPDEFDELWEFLVRGITPDTVAYIQPCSVSSC